MTTCHRESSSQCINLRLSLQLPTFPCLPTFEYSLFRKLYRRIKISISSFESEFIRVVRCVLCQDWILISPRICVLKSHTQKRKILIRSINIFYQSQTKNWTKISQNNFYKNRRNYHTPHYLIPFIGKGKRLDILLNTHAYAHLGETSCRKWKTTQLRKPGESHAST